MSLSIILDEEKVSPTVWRMLEWHVGEKFPITYHVVNVVQEIQADGDELRSIRNLVDGIPFGLHRHGDGEIGRVQRWFGSDAQFICGVLQMEYRGRE